jgi:HD-GYP domain-containing protein (c-di-GMP phosphodiesterase class II)
MQNPKSKIENKKILHFGIPTFQYTNWGKASNLLITRIKIVADYIEAKKSRLKYYQKIPLYYQTKERKLVLYKPAGKTIEEVRLEKELVPGKLYIKQEDKIKAIQVIQKVFNRQLSEDVRSNNPDKVKETLVNIVQETLAEPRSGSLEGVSETVNILINEYTKDSDVIKNLLIVSKQDYSTVIHSINVMAIVLGYANFIDCSLYDKKILGLSALLHDVGKTKIDTALLTAPRKLTDEEFNEIKQHTIRGHDILSRCNFRYKEIATTALQHHEKLDGSGYPYGITNIEQTAQIVGFIDCYEALTNDDRPYRNAMSPLKTLKLIKQDVQSDKFSRNIFETFAYSLL